MLSVRITAWMAKLVYSFIIICESITNIPVIPWEPILFISDASFINNENLLDIKYLDPQITIRQISISMDSSFMSQWPILETGVSSCNDRDLDTDADNSYFQ